MKKSVGQSELDPAPSQEEIARRATQLWEGYGRPKGRDKEIWLEAEQQLLGVDSEVEGTGNISVSAPLFDEATRQQKPVTRQRKVAPKVKPPVAASPASATKAASPAKETKPAPPLKSAKASPPKTKVSPRAKR